MALAPVLLQTVNPAITTNASVLISPTQTALGSLLIIFAGTSGTADTISSITDNGRNTWVKAYGVNATVADIEIWYTVTGIPTSTVSVNFSGTANSKSIFLREYSGMSNTTTVFDRTANAQGTSNPSSTGNTAATRTTVELIVANCVLAATTPGLTVGAGYSIFVSQTISANFIHAIEAKLVSAIGAQSAGMGVSGTSPNWTTGIATFVVEIPINFNNYEFISAGNGISVTEKRR